MKVIMDYHVHSVYSKNGHGKSTPEEIVKRALELGLKEISISDHGSKHFLYGISKKKIKKLNEEIKYLDKKYKDIKVHQGIECNLLSYEGDTDIDDEVKEYCSIIMAGFHYGVLFKNFSSLFNFLIVNLIGKFSIRVNDYITEKNTEAVVKMIKNNNFKILTHPGEKININMHKIAEIAEEKGIILEINSSHEHLTVEDLEVLKDYDVDLIIGSDAHHRVDMGKYESAIQRIKNSQFPVERVINLEE